MKPFPIVLALAPLATCCSESKTSTFSFHHVEAAAGVTTIHEAGVEIEIVDVPYRSTTSVLDGHTESSRSLLGHPFGIHDGRFSIGPSSYGPAPAGSRIEVKPTGVTIDGERRGDLPPALAEAVGELHDPMKEE